MMSGACRTENYTVLFIGGMPRPREHDYYVNSFEESGIIERQSKNNYNTLLLQDKETWSRTIYGLTVQPV